MTYTEAKKEIDSRIELANRNYRDVVPDYIEVLEMASIALERQMPRKPTPYIETIGICKSCEDSVHRLDNYCPQCGQALDWSKE